MAKETFVINPLEHTYDMSKQPLTMHPSAANWPTLNVDVFRHSIRKRCGYTSHRTLRSDAKLYGAWTFRTRDGTRHTMMLTDTDLLQVKTGTDETFQYRTPRQAYTGTKQVDEIDGVDVTFEAAAELQTDGIEDGDYFILDSDWADQQIEPDASWRKISGDPGTETTLTLATAYENNHASPAGEDATIRKVYSVPDGDRWSVAIVDNKFCFTNRNVNVQYWSGEDGENATDLDSTNAKEARFAIEYANRLFLADLEISGTREPWSVQWSKEGDPTDWTDSTAGSVDLLDTNDHIMGLGKVGNMLIVYKRKSIIFGRRTGVSTAPVIFPTQRNGIGLCAPWGKVSVLGSEAFLGDDDFYFIEGDQPVSIGERIRDKFSSLVSDAERRKAFAWSVPRYNKALWSVVTSEGRYVFVWDYKEKEWTSYEFWDEITGGGQGAN